MAMIFPRFDMLSLRAATRRRIAARLLHALLPLVVVSCLCLASISADEPPARQQGADQAITSGKDALGTPAHYAPRDATDEDEALIFTPAGFDRPGQPATMEGRDDAAQLQITVRDEHTGEPTFCRINVVGSDGNYYEPSENRLTKYSLTGQWPMWPRGWGNRPGKAPIRYFGRFFYSSGRATVAVPPGAVRVEVWKGFEYRPATLTTQLSAGQKHCVELTLAHAVPMPELGYYSGDAHLHLERNAEEDDEILLDLLEAEDIHFGTVLAYNEPAGPYIGIMDKMDTPQRRGFGLRSTQSRGTYHILSGQEYRSSTYGHMNLIMHPDLVLGGQTVNADNWPLYGDVARQAQAMGGVAIYAHGGYAQAVYADAVQGRVDAVELLQFGIYRGIGLLDWYHLLNAGFRFPILGSSDYPACRKLGDALTFVRLQPEKVDFEHWLRGATAGQSFVSTGPLLLMEVDNQPPGTMIQRAVEDDRMVKVRVRVRSEVAPVTDIQIVVNGRIAQHLQIPLSQGIGSWVDFEVPIELEGSSWIAARAFSLSRLNTPDAEAHTNPVYIYYGDKAPYNRESLDAILAALDKQIAAHRSRDFSEKAQVLAYFERSRDILLKIREAQGAPAAGHPSQLVDATALVDPGQREHTEEQLKAFLKPVPPKPVSEALQTFETLPGFEMQLVASEPLVVDPVAAAFDEQGNLYVCELRDYPYKPKQGNKPLGTVRLLRDTDDDGNFDESHVFADELLWAAGVAPWKGGVFVAAAPDIWYLKDTNGDWRADIRRRVFTGFGTGNQQAMVNNLRLGLDHWIYGSTAGNGGTIRHADRPAAPPVVVDGQDFRFDPVSERFETISGTVQFGNTVDDWGNRFLCSESQPLLHVVLPSHYLQRNPYLAAPYPLHNLAPPPVPIHRISPLERWRMIRSGRRIAHSTRPAEGAGVSHHVVDAAAGVTVYRGGAYPTEFYGQVFVGDAQNNLVHRRTLEPSGVTFVSMRADEGTEFVRSSDNWFRPVNFVNAPDGTLYVLDLSREILEAIHIPLDVVKHLDLRSGRDRGRIYRIAPSGFQYPGAPDLGAADTLQLVAALESPHGWWRDTAQRLLFERQDAHAAEPLRRILYDSTMSPARLHALWSLEGLNALREEDLLKALDDPHPALREHALRLAEGLLAHSPALTERLLDLVEDPAPRVRMQAAFTLGQLPDRQRGAAALLRLVRSDGTDPWMRAAILSSSIDTAAHVLSGIISDATLAASGEGSALIQPLAQVVGARAKPEELELVLATLRRDELHSAAQNSCGLSGRNLHVLTTMGQQMVRSEQRLGEPAFEQSLSTESRTLLKETFAAACAQAMDDAADEALRASAVRYIGCYSLAHAKDSLVALLGGRTPIQVQLEAVRALANYPNSDVAAQLIESFRNVTPQVQELIIEVLLSRDMWMRQLLEAAAAQRMSLALLQNAQRSRLLEHADPQIRGLAQEQFGASSLLSREQVVEQYRDVLQLAAEAGRGQLVFQRECAQCHRLEGHGHAVGPDLTSAAAQESAALLVHLLDPNRHVLPNFVQYVIEDASGRIFTGLLAAQSATSVSLIREEGRVEHILRSDIAALTSTNKSLMPEGLEQKISRQDLADLLAYLQSLRVSNTQAPPLDVGTEPGLIEP